MSKMAPALFLDRDGVVNKNLGYVFEISKFEFFPEIFEICSLAMLLKMRIVIVTNQSGIGRGLFSEEQYQILTRWMIDEFNSQGITIDEVIHAPEKPESDEDSLLGRRKPSPKMFWEASEKYNLDMPNSIMIGDNESDMIAAERAGIKHRVLIGETDGSTVASKCAVDHRECLEIVAELLRVFRSL
jgi:D-glycero-D-manno-heptose 1,7-bisphosphate phosphatase